MSWQQQAPQVVAPEGEEVYSGGQHLSKELEKISFAEMAISDCIQAWRKDKAGFIEAVEMLEIVMRGNAPYNDMEETLKDVDAAWAKLQERFKPPLQIPIKEQVIIARDKFAALYKLAQRMKLSAETF